MVAVLATFRPGDRVIVEAREEFFSYIDGWRARVAVVGPAEASKANYQVPGGYALIEADQGGTFLVPFDQLRLTV